MDLVSLLCATSVYGCMKSGTRTSHTKLLVPCYLQMYIVHVDLTLDGYIIKTFASSPARVALLDVTVRGLVVPDYCSSCASLIYTICVLYMYIHVTL